MWERGSRARGTRTQSYGRRIVRTSGREGFTRIMNGTSSSRHMPSRLPQYLAILIAASFVATPLLGEAGKTKAKPKAAADGAASGTPKKKGSPTPSKKKPSPSPKAEDASEATPRATPKTTPKG